MIPYTYRIQFTPTGEYYYGVRHAKDCKPSELWITYFTSSAVVKHLIKEHGKDKFTFEVRKIFESAESAITWESKVNRHTRKWNNYLNRTDAKSIGNMFGKKGGLIGGANCKRDKKGIHSDEQMLRKAEFAAMGGKASVEQKVGLHAVEKHWIINPSIELQTARKASGKKTGSMPWWNNGINDTKSNTKPGPDWVSGMLAKGQYWNNGTEQRVTDICPGPGWVRGGITKTVNGREWWTNGVDQQLVFQSPGPEWKLGKIPGSSGWWNNGSIQCRQAVCPGDGWVKGMLTKWVNNGIENKSTIDYENLVVNHGYAYGRIRRKKTD